MDESQNDFVKKSVEQPIMGTEVRQKIQQSEVSVPAYENGFYQNNKYYIWAISAGVLIIGVLGFFAFRKQPVAEVKEAKVELSVSAPENIPSGGDAVYTIRLQNNDSQKVTQIRVEVVYPQGVSFLSSVPKPQGITGNIFEVPDLIPGQNTALVIRAKVAGNVGEQKQLIARLFYHYSNYSSEFLKERAFNFELAASEVALNILGPESVSSSQLVAYSIKYKNNSEKLIQNVRVKVNLPDNFSLAQADPAVSLGQNVWEVGNLNPGAEGQILLQGNFKSGNAGESRTWNAEIMSLSQTGEYNTLSTSQISTSISSLPLMVTQELSTNLEQSGGVVKPGETLRYDLSYQNNSNVAATGVNVVITLNSKAIDLSSIKAEGGEVNNNTIIWSASGVPNLEILNPSESGNLSFSFSLKNPAVKDSSTNLTVVSDVKIKSNEYQTFLPGNQISLKVSSPSVLSSSLAFVSGQLPPKVGQSSTYKIKLSLSNSTNEYGEAVLYGFLPLGSVVFEPTSVSGSESAKVQYDPATGKLTWNIGVLAANAGRFSQAKTLEFNVRLSPSQSMGGQSAQLLKSISFQAKDNFTEEKIQLTGENITTQSLSGNFGSGTVEE
ncbi:MAG: hypothetical protein JNN11_04500 [Candidatus Doudnabacteria bacterium]|nr:hypothetical protein [Candidatus Doudnabacteria bacterium]